MSLFQSWTDAEALAQVVESGAAPHYMLLIDRSTKGQTLLEVMKTHPDLLQRLTSEAMKAWDATGWPFVVMWGTWRYTGGLTIPCIDLDVVLDQALPVVVQRNRERGGLCTCIPGMADEAMARVMARLAQLEGLGGAVH